MGLFIFLSLLPAEHLLHASILGRHKGPDTQPTSTNAYDGCDISTVQIIMLYSLTYMCTCKVHTYIYLCHSFLDLVYAFQASFIFEEKRNTLGEEFYMT